MIILNKAIIKEFDSLSTLPTFGTNFSFDS